MSKSTAYARGVSDRASLYDAITNKIIAELEAGRVPWVQPWGTAAAMASLAMPRNAATGRHYSGINVLILWGAVIEHGYPGQSWLTFRQALGLGGNVRKGECGTTVIYADRFVPDRFVPDDEKQRARDTGEEARAIPFLKPLHRLQRGAMREPNRERCSGCTPSPTRYDRAPGRGVDPRDWNRLPHRRGPRLLRPGTGLRAGSAASGLLRADRLASHRAARASSGHEHSSRLDRDLIGGFGTKKYAFEELVAEINAAFCCATLGIVPTVRHADYIGSWFEVLREDNRAIVRAASQASKAADWLLGFLPADEQAEPSTDRRAA